MRIKEIRFVWVDASQTRGKWWTLVDIVTNL